MSINPVLRTFPQCVHPPLPRLDQCFLCGFQPGNRPLCIIIIAAFDLGLGNHGPPVPLLFFFPSIAAKAPWFPSSKGSTGLFYGRGWVAKGLVIAVMPESRKGDQQAYGLGFEPVRKSHPLRILTRASC